MGDVTVIGHLGAGNLGDELMLQGLLARLDGMGAAVTVVRSRPSDWLDPRPHGPRTVDRFRADHLRALRTPLVLCGGTHFHDAEVEVPRRRAQAAIGLLGAQLLAQRAPFHLVAVGIGPLDDAVTRRLTRPVLRRATTATVRDPASRDLVAELSGAHPPLVHDLAWWAPPLAPAPPTGVPGAIERVVVIPVPHPTEQPRSIPDAAQVRSVLDGHPATISVVPLNRSARNLASAADLARGLPDAEVWSSPPGVDPLTATVEEVASADLVIAARFHGLLAARALGRPTIAAPYHPKVDELAAELEVPTIGRGAAAIDAARLTPAWRPDEASRAALDDQLRTVVAGA